MSRSVKSRNPLATPNTGRVDYPGQHAQVSTQTPEQQDHRVDAPAGKYQYINQEPGQSAPVKETQPVADNSKVDVSYTVKVNSAGPHAEQVADLVLGSSWRRRNIKPDGPYSCTMSEAQKARALELAQKVLDLGAEIEVTKNISVEIKIV